MKVFIKFIIIIFILMLLISNYFAYKTIEKHRKEILDLRNQNQKLHYSLDSLRIILFKNSNTALNKKEIRDYIKSFLSKRNDPYIPDIYPLQTDFEISQKFSLKHPAIDLASEEGSQVFATASGIVDTTFYDKYFGNTIILNHLNGYKTKYSHLAKILVPKNYFVKKNSLIGLVGNTGRSSAPHLHYEIIKENKNINPLTLIKGKN